MNKFVVLFAAFVAVSLAQYQPRVRKNTYRFPVEQNFVPLRKYAASKFVEEGYPYPAKVATAPVYGVPAKPAEVYGVPEIVEKSIKPIENNYKYSIPANEKPVVPAPAYGLPVVSKPAEVYGGPKVVEKHCAPVKYEYKFTIPATEKPVVPAAVYGVPLLPKVAPYPAKIYAKIAPYPAAPVKPAAVYGVQNL